MPDDVNATVTEVMDAAVSAARPMQKATSDLSRQDLESLQIAKYDVRLRMPCVNHSGHFCMPWLN